jgi:hypothetical protein
MAERMTVDRALARVMELHKLPPGEDVLRKELRLLLDRLRSTGWSDGYSEGLHDAQ